MDTYQKNASINLNLIHFFCPGCNFNLKMIK